MKPIVITIRRRGFPARRVVGLFASTAYATTGCVIALAERIDPEDELAGVA